MTVLYPLKFTPILKDKIWGGNKLNQLLGKSTPSKCAGESWELSDVEDNTSIVANGALKGTSLKTLLQHYQANLVGQKVYDHFGAKFPLLIKYIDAKKDLSVQLHPNDELAKERHQSFGKTEIDVDDINVDIMSFSGHKIGGPKGIGAVYIRDLRKRNVMPVIHGAGQEQGVRGGTVAAPLILGFGEAINSFPQSYKNFANKQIRSYFLEQLVQSDISFSINGNKEALPHIVSLTLPKTNIGV